MVMTWTSLTAPKGTVGSIMNWVNYSKLDQFTVVDEAQALIYETLRVREMRTEWTFGMASGQANQPLLARFLDPIGRLFDVTNGTDYGHSIESSIAQMRAYDQLSGSFAANPFSVTINQTGILAHLVGHGLTQDSTLTVANSTIASLNAAYPVISIVDADNLTLGTDIASNATAVGIGGPSCTYTANRLLAGIPARWTVWDEQMKFDTAFQDPATLKLLCYRSPSLLSATNLSNWLTNRYPMLMRKACMAAAADFMKDDAEYKKQVEALSSLIGSTAAGNDMIYRGAEFGTDTP